MSGRPSTGIEDGVQERHLGSWQEFVQVILDDFVQRPAYIFRGQAIYGWPLRSSIDRLEARFPQRKNLSSAGGRDFFECAPLSEDEQLRAFRNAARGRLEPALRQATTEDDELWALGQHHGLATPLLDWTMSPFVALFFAFEEQLATVEPGSLSESEFRGVYALSTSAVKDPGSAPEEPVQVFSPAYPSRRLLTQAGVFLKMPRHSDLDPYVREHFEGDDRRAILMKFRIPSTDRARCLVALDKMNINRASLFPDLDGAARYINSMWEPGREALLPYI